MNILNFKNLRDSRFSAILDVIPFLKENKVWVAGGALRTVIDKEDVLCDFDIFLSSLSDITNIQSDLGKHGWLNVFTCPKGELYTYKHPIISVKLQVITKRGYSSAFDLITSFDFSPCCAAYDGHTLTTSSDFVRSVRKKVLYTNQITYPVASLKRLVKYANKGYRLSHSALQQFVFDVNKGIFDGDALALYID